MKYIIPIAGMLCTAFVTVLMLVFMVAGAANSNAEQLRSMKLWAGGLSLLSVGCIVAGIVLMRYDRFGLATIVAFVPVAVMFIIFAVSAS